MFATLWLVPFIQWISIVSVPSVSTFLSATVSNAGVPGDFDSMSGVMVRGRADTFSKNCLFLSCVITVAPFAT